MRGVLHWGPRPCQFERVAHHLSLSIDTYVWKWCIHLLWRITYCLTSPFSWFPNRTSIGYCQRPLVYCTNVYFWPISALFHTLKYTFLDTEDTRSCIRLHSMGVLVEQGSYQNISCKTWHHRANGSLAKDLIPFALFSKLSCILYTRLVFRVHALPTAGPADHYPWSAESGT